jgi:alpha-tubulin suppressor-like RCC1 family protein
VIPSEAHAVASISCGLSHNPAVPQVGTLACWGDSRCRYDRDNRPAVEALISVSSGSSHSAAVLADGSLICWGKADYCQVPEGLAMMVMGNILL